MTLSEAVEIHIRSKDCIQNVEGHNTDISFELVENLVRKPNHEMHLSVSSAEIPYTWYAFSGYLKTNYLKVQNEGSYTVPDGNYDIFELVDLINAQNSFPCTCTFDENSARVTFTNKDSSSSVQLLTSDSDSAGIYKILGFDTSSSATIQASGSLTGSGVINFQVIHSIFLHSDLNLTNVITSESGAVESIVDKIPVGRSVPFGTVVYDPYQSAPFSCIVGSDNLKLMRFQLKDQNGRLLQLNNTNYEFTLLVEQHHMRDETETPPPPPPPPPPPLMSRRSEMEDQPQAPITLKRPRIFDPVSTLATMATPTRPLPQPARPVTRSVTTRPSALNQQAQKLQRAVLMAKALNN